VLGDPDLDNPQFLFDGGSDAETPTGSTTVPEGVPFAASGDVTQMHDALADESDDTPPGKRAPTPVMGLDPEVSARQQELTRELTAPPADPAPHAESAASKESLFDFGRQDDYEATPVPGREPALRARADAAPPGAPAARELDPDPEPDTLSKLAEEEVEESISRWDAPVASPPSPRRVEVLRPKDAPAPSRARIPAAPRRAEGAEPVREAEPALFLPMEPAPAPIWLRGVVALVAAGLLASGVRASLQQVVVPGPGPAAVEALGWTATELLARPARDAAGDPTIAVEGQLRGPQAVPFPRVRIGLLDAAGRSIGNGADARIDVGGRFLATLSEPPATARSYRVELSEPVVPPAPPAETTTASPVAAPEAPVPEPDAQAATAPAAAEP
jgi:hypothetical protein